MIDDDIVSEFDFFELFGLEIEEKVVVVKEEKIMKYYIVKDEFGKGRFGVVCKCIDNKIGKVYVVKFIKCFMLKDW